MRRLLLAAILTAVLAGPGRASSVLDGGFETDPTAWNGSAQVVESLALDPSAGGFSVTGPTQWQPTEGQHFGLLSADSQQAYQQMSTTIEAQAGDVLTFDWFWVAPSPFGPDQVQALLTRDQTAYEIFTRTGADETWGSANVYTQAWTPVSYTVQESGSYTLLFSVEVVSETLNSNAYLGVDNARIVPAEVIPEPVTFAALAGSLVSLGAYLRRRDRAQGRN